MPNTTLTGVSRTRAPALPRQARQLWLERANTQARIALVLLAHLGDIDLEFDVVPLALAVAPEHEGDQSRHRMPGRAGLVVLAAHWRPQA